jgi:hypothetical protein
MEVRATLPGSSLLIGFLGRATCKGRGFLKPVRPRIPSKTDFLEKAAQNGD